MKHNFCIASLTHDADGRGRSLYGTYAQFYKNTNWNGPLEVHLFLNGSNEEIANALEKIESEFCDSTKEKYFVLSLYESDKNLGCSIGINSINAITQNYEYVLFLEGDWICYTDDKDWLEKSLNFMENRTDVDMIYLRLLRNSFKIRHHSGYWALEKDSIMQLENSDFRSISSPIYTNNPMIRRNARFFDTGILPLPEIENEVHGSDNWGKAEIDIESKPKGILNGYYYKFGVFIHYDYKDDFNDDGTFKLRNPLYCPLFDKCKFGFIEDMEPVFCVGCTEDYEDIQDVDDRYIHYHRILDMKKQLSEKK